MTDEDRTEGEAGRRSRLDVAHVSAFRHRHATVIRAVAVVAVLAAVALPFYTRYFRGTWDLRKPATKIFFRAREYRYGRDVPREDAAAMKRIGSALWPDGDILTVPEYSDNRYVPTGIVVETPARAGHFRSYGLEGGP